MQDAPARIGLLGGECTGKSTLAHALGEVLPACVVDEALREFVDRTGRTPLVHEQAAIVDEQAARVTAAQGRCAHPWVIADPAPLMTAVYSVLYFDDASLLPAAVADAQAYDLLVWCAPDLPWRPDGGMRDGPPLRTAADRLLAGIVEDLVRGPGTAVLRVTGGQDARVRSVTAAVDGRAWQRGRPSPAS